MKRIIKIILICILILIALVISVNFLVVLTTKGQVKDFSGLADKYEAIVVLGASVQDNEPSPMLEDRIQMAIDLYELGYAPKIIMSGDNSTEYYDEVNVMKDYAIKEGTPSEDIFLDHSGLSTYESIYRMKEVFELENILIISQEYHLYRALFIANSFGISATGVASEGDDYSGQINRDFREILARNKDFIFSIFKPEPNDLGDTISIDGDGNETNEE